MNIAPVDIPADDIGDEPAKTVIKKNEAAMGLRRAEYTKEQLEEIEERIRFVGFHLCWKSLKEQQFIFSSWKIKVTFSKKLFFAKKSLISKKWIFFSVSNDK